MTRISRFRVQESVAIVAIALALALGGFTFGFVMGMTVPRNYKCPEVPGAKVVSTIDRRDSQTCVFVRETYGKAKVNVKL